MGVSRERGTSAAVIYPVTDNMGEHELQRLIMELLRPMLARFLAEQGVVAHVGADQFIYWEKGNVTKRVAPDVYILPGVSQDIVIPCWKKWETGIAPSFALEVAGVQFAKDYDDSPALYSALGVSELVIFDPHTRPGSRSRRVRWQVYRRANEKRGRRGLIRVEVSQSDRIYSSVLGAWLRAVDEGDAVRVRLGLGVDGDELYPTAEEAERAAKEVESAAKDAERAVRIRAEAEVQRLRALLAKEIKRSSPSSSKKRRV